MTPKAPNKPAELLSDLESIRALLGDDFPDNPPNSEALDPDSIPLLSDIVEPAPAATSGDPSDDEPRETSVRSAFRTLAERHIDHELRTAANLILQEVIDDFVPQIEAELKRRLESRIDRLVRTPPPRS
ncbi:DNA polymerase III subunit chi [Pseudomonas stutzeri]|uniref:DNA polymerase III subunit chi n=1 Tax=Stutzerimonas stutzeri TaxID=316 RepID=A0A2N8S5U6_STUST|nr:DNA polymerase III subunit chi [Stutzerimonas stutzeri]MCQ4296982.1 DNA polymerase III subunit chi [Stutzerimonas stutzeri]PNF81997.1 DNA polymerase III subunit chi [Stutzerimonas stutzeri]